MRIYRGVGVSPLIALGKIKFYFPEKTHVDSIKNLTAASPEFELARYEDARQDISQMLSMFEARAREQSGDSAAAIFSLHKVMLEDEDFDGEIKSLIKSGTSAEVAVINVSQNLEKLFAQMPSEYMRERVSDLAALRDRLIDSLGGQRNSSTEFPIVPSIIVASDLTPADTVMFERKNILGFALENGSRNSHTAILARSMDIAAVCSLGEISREFDGFFAIIDGIEGKLIISPDDAITSEYDARIKTENESRASYEALRGKESRTGSGEKMIIAANVGGEEDIRSAVDFDAEGIGLVRSEFLYMNFDRLPGEDEQFEFYKRAVSAMKGKEVVIRTLDIGADKQISYLDQKFESNPALGVRGIRSSLKKTEVFSVQIKAILRASAFGCVSVMLPLITTLDEIRCAKEIISDVKKELDSEGKNYSENVKLGIMIETPAAAIISDILAKEVDFFSIGTNDLVQYTLAADRENGELSNLTEGIHESVKRLISYTAQSANKAKIGVSVCGELAGDFEFTEFFVRCGIRKLSVSPSKILKIRHKLLQIKL